MIHRSTGLVIDRSVVPGSEEALPDYLKKVKSLVEKRNFSDVRNLIICCDEREVAIKAACYFGRYRDYYEDKVLLEACGEQDLFYHDNSSLDEKEVKLGDAGVPVHSLIVFEDIEPLNERKAYQNVTAGRCDDGEYPIFVLAGSCDIDKKLDMVMAYCCDFKVVIVDKATLLLPKMQVYISEEDAIVMNISPPGIDYYVSIMDLLLSGTGIKAGDIEQKRAVINMMKKRYGGHFGEEQVIYHVLQMVRMLEKSRRERAELQDYFIEKPVESALERLDKMTGLTVVKRVMHEYAALAREEVRNEKIGCLHKNMIFYGNPGTGKTTAAHLVADIFLEAGIGSGAFVQASRKDLIGEYVGHTSPKIAGLFERSRGGVLFIDEAGFLCQKRSGGFVEEAVKELVRYMENYPDVTVIFAMYEREAQEFLAMDQGLGSRISRMVFFDEYTRSELVEIASEMFVQRGYCLNSDWEKSFKEYLSGNGISKGNARDVRKIVESIILSKSVRAFSEKETSAGEEVITGADVREGIERFVAEQKMVCKKRGGLKNESGLPDKMCILM